MKKILMMFLILCSFILKGCYGVLDIEQLSIATAIGIDKEEEEYVLSAQIISPLAVGEKPIEQARVVVYTAKGKTVFEALRNLTLEAPNRVYLAHFQILVFGEEAAKSGIKEAVYFFYTDHESRQKFSIICVKEGKASDLLKVVTPNHQNPTDEVHNKIQAALENQGTATELYQYEYINIDRFMGSELILTSFEIIGEPEKGSDLDNIKKTSPETKIKISGLAVFKNDKLKGYINEDEAQGYNHIVGKVKSAVLPIKHSKEELSFEIMDTKVKRKFELVNNKPKITIDYEVKGRIAQTRSGLIQFTKEDIKEVEDLANKEIKKRMEDFLDKIQKEYSSDVVDFCLSIYRSNPKYWDSIKADYDTIFKELEVEINVKSKVIRRSF